MRTTTITHPDGSVTTARSRTSFGCVTLFAIAVAVGLPSTWPAPWNVLGYVLLGTLVVLGLAGRLVAGRSRPATRPAPVAYAPPPPPPPLAPPPPPPVV